MRGLTNELTDPGLRHKVSDLFRCLGPVAVFSAKHHWSAPRTVQLRKKEDEGGALISLITLITLIFNDRH